MKAIPPEKYRWCKRWPRRHVEPHLNLVLRRTRVGRRGSVHDIELEIGAGWEDQIYPYRDGSLVYVVGVNRLHDYVSVEQFDLLDAPELIRERSSSGPGYPALRASRDLFLQGSNKLVAAFGPRGMNYHDHTLAVEAVRAMAREKKRR